MHARCPFLAFALVVATLPCACDDATFDAAIIEDDDAAILRDGSGRTETLPSNGGGMWINNGLDDPDVSGLDPRESLASDEGLAPDSPLLLDPSRRDTVRYLVECALPLGHSIEKDVEGEPEPLTFHGAIGLAHEWETEGCDQDCQEWVSACMLARTNASGQAVTIWMRADHDAIGDGASLAFPVYEASFFGNLFAGSSKHFCQGTTLAGPLVSQLQGRTCAGLTTEACGFVKYTQCESTHRCQYPLLGGVLGGFTKGSAVGCSSEGHAFHTISTYVAPL